MRNIFISAAILTALITNSASAANLKSGYPVCVTQDLLEQTHLAATSGDSTALMWLADNGCTMTSEPLHVTVLGTSSWGGYAHIRAYRGKHASEVWTDRDAVEGYDPLNPLASR
jgi:hypothetical protein